MNKSKNSESQRESKGSRTEKRISSTRSSDDWLTEEEIRQMHEEAKRIVAECVRLSKR